MKTFEIFSSKNDNGRRKFKAILYKIFPDSCVDEINQVGTEYNYNGITWIREYCENALDSIKGMSLRCEFTDEDRTEILGHGDTDIIDGVPIFENAVKIGTFTKGYIEEIETEDGIITACIGEGEIDSQCYHNYTQKLLKDLENGNCPSGSVEIMRTENNNGIIYKYGYKDKGRIPTEFIHSGYALLGIRPADDNAKLIELNEKHKEDMTKMNETEMKNLISQVIDEYLNRQCEIDKCKSEMEKCKEQCESQIETVTTEKNQIIADSEKIQEALASLQNEFNELDKKYHALWEERDTLDKALGEAKARERLSEMNSAIAMFTDAEKAYADEDIAAFKADPMTSEINSIVDKIWAGIGKEAKEKNIAAEKNSAHVEDIFAEVTTPNAQNEDITIF